jgi:hypothetical protein
MRCGTKRPPVALLCLGSLIAVVVGAACNINPRGEWGPLQCSDGKDNDGDGLIDCDDPDCWAFVCDARPPAIKDMEMDASQPVLDAGMSESKDSGWLPLPPPIEEEDSGMMSIADSGTPSPSCALGEVACPAGDTCLDGVCKPTGIAGDYTITVMSAVVPEKSLTGVCYDFDVSCPPILACGICQPDPFAVIVQNGVKTVGTTNHRINTRVPNWEDQSFKMTLKEMDRLELQVWDWDPFYTTKIFSCTPDLRDLPTGMLHCSPRSGTTIEPGSDGPYIIVARVKKLP